MLSRVMQDPYVVHVEAELAGLARPEPDWAKHIRVNCSS